jgi:hypothetical protein
MGLNFSPSHRCFQFFIFHHRLLAALNWLLHLPRHRASLSSDHRSPPWRVFITIPISSFLIWPIPKKPRDGRERRGRDIVQMVADAVDECRPVDTGSVSIPPPPPLSAPPTPLSSSMAGSDTSAAAYDSWTCRLQTWSHLPMWDPVFAQNCMKHEFYMHASSPAGNIGLERTVDCGKRGNIEKLSSDLV